MRLEEFYSIIAGILVFAVISSFSFMIEYDWNAVGLVFLLAVIIVLVSVFAKKSMAYFLDADVEHDIWRFQRFAFYPQGKFIRPIPMGIILPLFVSLFTIGIVKLGTILTYETRVLKARAARRFGFYSFTEMTDWHNGIIGCAGIIGALLLAVIAYFLPMDAELLAKLSIYYAAANLIPFSNLDGAQIFYGSRLLWSVIASITLIFFIFALII